MKDNIKMIEIGCGKTKTPGYIGVDRFPLPGVDIVADINIELPFEDDSIDVVYACHSLEHMDNIYKVMKQIYRICKNKAIVHILAPYYNTSINEANIYHKINFNEDVYRFFTTYDTNKINEEDYYCPHSTKWGLENSDNSEATIQIEPIKMEYFYYKEYRHLNEMQKQHARKALQNVCDQFYSVLTVNKTGKPFTDDEFDDLIERAYNLEPDIIPALRQRDLQFYDEKSIMTDISEQIEESQIKKIGLLEKQIEESQIKKIGLLEKQIEESQIKKISLLEKQIEESQIKKIGLLEKQIEVLLKKEREMHLDRHKNESQNFNEYINISKEENRHKLDSVENAIKQLNETINNLQLKMEEKTNYILLIENKLLKLHDNKTYFHNRFSVFKSSQDISMKSEIVENRTMDSIVMKCKKFKSKSIVIYSSLIPSEGYFEYRIQGYGDNIHYFLSGNLGAEVLVETIQNGKIVKQEITTISSDGFYESYIGGIKGFVNIRFKVSDLKSIVRTLEISNRVLFVAANKDLAAFID